MGKTKETANLVSNGFLTPNNGNLGIGAANNTSYDINAQNVLIASDGNTGITIRSAGSTPFAMIHFADGVTDNSEKRAGRIVYQHDGDNMMFNTANTERLRIRGDGTILAGGQSSSYDGTFVNLELRKDSNTVGGSMTLVNDTASQAGATCEIDCYQNYRGAGKIVFGRENANNWQSSAGGAASFLAFHTNNAGTIAERLRITSDGKVGINRIDPDQRLNVSGNIELNAYDNAGGAGGYFTSKGLIIGNLFDAGKSYTGSDDRTACIWQERGLDLDFATNDTLRMKITYDGNIGIGTDNPGQKLTVQGTTSLMATNSTNQWMAYTYTDNTFRLNYNGSGADEITINSTGRVIATQSSSNIGLELHATGSGNGSQIKFHNDHGVQYVGTSGDTSGDLIIWQESNADIVLSTSNTARLRITSDGSIGTGGLIASSGNLAVNSTIRSQNSSSNISYIGFTQHTGNTTVGSMFSYMGGDGRSTGYLNFSTNDTERLRITSNGRLVIGHTAEVAGAYDNSAQTKQVQIVNGANDGNQGLGIYSYSSAGWAPRLELALSRSSSKGGHTVVTDGQSCGLIVFNGSDGTNFSTAAMIGANVSGSPANDSIPGSLSFYTSPGSGLSERLRIDSSGNVNIGAKDYNTHNSTVDSLQIGYALNLYEDSYTSGNDNYLILANNARYAASGGNTYMRNDEAMRIYMNAGQFAYQNAPAGTAGNSITFTDRLLITSGGQVIVNGTTNLAHPNMDDIIVGDASGNRGITVASATDGYGTLAFGDSTDGSGNDRYQGFVEYYHDDNSMRLGTVASERLRIVSNGDMRLGASSFGAPKTKLDIIEDQTIPFAVTANTGTFVGVMVRTRYYLEFSVEFPQHATETSIQLKFSRTQNAPSISIDYFSGGGYQIDHGVTGVAYISFYSASGNTLYSGTNHQSAYGGATPSWSHGNGTTDVLFKLSNIAYSNGSMCHFRINMPRGGINNVTVDRTTP